MNWLSDFLTAFSLAFRTTRSRGNSARRLREIVAELRLEAAQLRTLLSERTSERDSERQRSKEFSADIEIAKREMMGVVRAHERLCEMLKTETALQVARAAKVESKR